MGARGEFRLAGACLALLIPLSVPAAPAAQQPAEEVFDYRVDWRLWHAGDIRLTYQTPPAEAQQPPQAIVTLKTRGFVDSLYSVENKYSVEFDDGFCAASSLFEVKEGRKRRRIGVTYQDPPGKVNYLERDLVKDRVALRKILNVPLCVHDELAALARLRNMPSEPGDVIELPISNGKKSVLARVEVQGRETIETRAGTFDAIRYEAFLFNNILYRRRGRLFFWLTDDERRLPIQFRIRLRVYFGTITLQLVNKESK